MPREQQQSLPLHRGFAEYNEHIIFLLVLPLSAFPSCLTFLLPTAHCVLLFYTVLISRGAV